MRKLIDIEATDLVKLKKRAEQHNMKVKPYVELLIKNDINQGK